MTKLCPSEISYTVYYYHYYYYYYYYCRYLSQYLSLKKDDYKAHKLLGDIYKYKNETDRALGAYKR